MSTIARRRNERYRSDPQQRQSIDSDCRAPLSFLCELLRANLVPLAHPD